MKQLLFLLMAAILLSACGSGDVKELSKIVESKEGIAKQDKEGKVDAVRVEPQEESKEERIVEVNKSELIFPDYTVEIQNIEIKEGKLLIGTTFKNDSLSGEKSFWSTAAPDVMQDGQVLKEVSGALYNPTHSYQYEVGAGSQMPVEFKFELVNETDDVRVNIIPTDWRKPAQEITFPIQ